MNRFGRLRVPIVKRFAVPQIKKRALNSLTAVQDTYYSIKDTFERHKVVFTISTSVASVGTAWLGYTLRHLHQSKVEKRLDSIENAMKNNYSMQHNEFKKLVGSSSYNPATHVVTAGVSLLVGYGLGWRGGRWYANRKLRKEQMKLLGQIKPKRWPLRLLRRSLTRPKSIESAVKTTEESAGKTAKALPKDAPITQPPSQPSPIIS